MRAIDGGVETMEKIIVENQMARTRRIRGLVDALHNDLKP